MITKTLKKIVLLVTILSTISIPIIKTNKVYALNDIINYTVKNGDSLWKISNYFNTSIDNIKSLNNLKNSTIYTGQTLIVKSNLINVTKYIVKSGDSLWKISQRFNTSIDSIKSLNNLKNSTIYIGQTLAIKNNPKLSSATIKNYTVNSGDNLWNISQKFNTSIDTIVKSNMLSSQTIMPSQILTIPVNSTKTVKPLGIIMYKSKVNANYGDIYTWQNARRLFTVDTKGTLKDLNTGISFNIKYYGGSNHADIIPLTKNDTTKIKKVFPTWTWENRPMILYFSQGGINYQLAVSMAGMPHSTTNIYDNGVTGHFDLYFYNSTSHKNNSISPSHQANILKANGQ